ncbi:MAG: hypothetical protein GOV02_00020 [Candidatus Aenigmarchaeota archaeon]|nr:hypothetical protein [Candidatus Aenigmarchaeota archaeon]
MVDKIVYTKPKPRGVDHNTNPALLVAGRYGTDDMIDIFGAEKTFSYVLDSQAEAVVTMSNMYPDVVPKKDALKLYDKANLNCINPARIREIEEDTGHDIIAINTAWGEKVTKRAGTHINKARTSADSTETAKALQLKKALEVYIDSLENLRDITLEKSKKWKHVSHMDTSHLYDALPTVLGRPFSHYGEMLQSSLNVLGFFYNNSIVGKWADATGNHHSATALGINGMKMQEKYCEKLEIGHMDAPAQIPGREFIADIIYGVARSAETMRNLGDFIRMGRSDDSGIFIIPRGKKGSSAMPHKDAKGGNPTVEEQTLSFSNYMRGGMSTELSACNFNYSRDLSASASDRIVLEDSFKWGDHVVRRLANLVYKLDSTDKVEDRVQRSYGVVTAQQVMTYLTDPRKMKKPMTRKDAHDLTGKLAIEAYDEEIDFVDILLQNEEITKRIPNDVLHEITNPMKYIGQSKEIIETVYKKYHGKQTI